MPLGKLNNKNEHFSQVFSGARLQCNPPPTTLQVEGTDIRLK